MPFACMNLIQDRATGLVMPAGGSGYFTRGFRVANVENVEYARLMWQGNTSTAGSSYGIRVDWSPMNDQVNYFPLLPYTPYAGTTQADIYGGWELVDPAARAQGDVMLRTVMAGTPSCTLLINLAIMYYR